jgi:hypothetical protein
MRLRLFTSFALRVSVLWGDPRVSAARFFLTGF